jgi:hypothetical protein
MRRLDSLERSHQAFRKRCIERDAARREAEIRELARRGARDLAQRQESARAATAARESRRGDWRAKARRLDVGLLKQDPDAVVKTRASIIADRLGLKPSTVEDFLYSIQRQR